MDEKLIKGAIIGIVILILGAFSGRSSPISNFNDNSSSVYFGKISKNLKKNEKISKNFEKIEKLNINKATLQQFKDAKVGIGEKKFKEIKANRPFSNVSQLREKGIVGFYTYKKLKIVATVGGE